MNKKQFYFSASELVMKKEKFTAAQLSGIMVKDWMKELKLKTSDEQ